MITVRTKIVFYVNFVIKKMKWDKEYEEYYINDKYDYDVNDYKLTTLCNYYDIRDNLFSHIALSDAMATSLLFQKLIQSKKDY